MDILDKNNLWSFVEEGESMVNAIQDETVLDEDNPIEVEINTCILQIEGAFAELERCLSALDFDR